MGYGGSQGGAGVGRRLGTDRTAPDDRRLTGAREDGAPRSAVDRVVLVEDHGLLATTLSSALRVAGHDVHVVDGSSHEALLAALGGDPSSTLVLLDLDLGVAGDATPLVASLRGKGARVVMVTGVEEPVRLARCVEAGALGIISKRSAFDELVAAVEQVASGKPLLTKHERDEHLALLRGHEQAEAARLADFATLTPREAEVLGLLMAGRTVQEIAAHAVVSVATVRTQVRAVLRKLDVPSQVAAIGRARAAGWVPPQERAD